MNYEIWDKKSPIKGKDAEYVIDSYSIRDEDEIILISSNNIITEIQFKDTLVANYSLDANLTCEEVAQKYLEIKQQEEQKQKEKIENKLTQQEEIEQLKKQNAELMYMMMQNQGGTI